MKIRSSALTRPDLQMEKGNEFGVTCQSCGNNEKKHVNDVRAEKNNLIILLGLGIGIIVTLFLLFNYGLIGTVGLAIPLIFWKQQMSATKSFNSYTIRRK